MLRINPSADAGYYLNSASERETAGAWSGILAQELGLGSLDHEALRPLLNNRMPDGSRLTPIDQKNRREGYDLTFSEPKSVSIMEQVAGDKRIGQARRDSVDEIMALLVEPRATTRKGNQRIVTGNLAYLPFDHLLARPVNGMPSPNGHVHVVCVNGTSHKGKRNALEIRTIVEGAPFIEAAWHALYAEKLKGLGYPIRKTKTAFEIDGIEDSTIRKFSPGTATIEDELERRSKSLQEQIGGAKTDKELRLLEGKVNRLKSPKGKSALGAQIREKKQPLQDEAEIKRNWFSRLTKDEAKTILTLHNRALLGKEPEPELPTGRLGAALAGLWQAVQKAPEKPVIEPEPIEVDKPAEILHSSLEALLRSDSRVSEEYLLTHALKAGVGQVTLPELQATLETWGQPVPKGHVRLYRAEAGVRGEVAEWNKQARQENGHAEAEGRWFVADRSMLDWYRADIGAGARTVYVDVPLKDVEKYRVSNSTEVIGKRSVKSFSRDPENEFFLPRELADRKRHTPEADILRLNGQVSTKQTIREETEFTDYARRGRLKWVKNKVEGLPDAGKLTFTEMLELVRAAGDKHLVIAGDAKGQREGQPLRLLREIAGMKPIGEPVKVRKPVQQAIKGFKKAMKRFVMRSITQKEREVTHVRATREMERGIQR